MEATHFYALLPMIIFLILSLVFYGKGLVHILTLGYALGLAFMAILNEWEILFFMPIVGTVIISLILFIYAMLKGDWL